jgi:ubiquitin-activating enzyme E1
LTSFIFTDFGKFTIYDKYCFKKKKFFIKKIERSEEGLVEIEWNKKTYPKISEYIYFKDVEGMNEINYNEENKKIFKIKPKSKNEFYIGNTLNFSEYKSGGYIEETVLPETIFYESFINKLDNPFDENDFVNHKKKFIFLIFRALMEFFDSKNRLPLPRNEEDFEELKKITKTIFANLNNESFKSNNSDENIIFEEIIIKNISFTCSAEIPCITSLIGGIVCQEIIKTTGKMKPINQFKVFDFLQYSTIIPDSSKDCNEDVETKYGDLISIFGKKVVEKIRNLNILLAGAGALGCELLKNLALFGIANSVLVIDDDNIEISNLNRQFLFHEEHKGFSKAEIACNSAKEINNDLKCNYMRKRIGPKNKDIFNSSYFKNIDFVLGAIDSQKGNYYLMKHLFLFSF